MIRTCLKTQIINYHSFKPLNNSNCLPSLGMDLQQWRSMSEFDWDQRERKNGRETISGELQNSGVKGYTKVWGKQETRSPWSRQEGGGDVLVAGFAYSSPITFERRNSSHNIWLPKSCDASSLSNHLLGRVEHSHSQQSSSASHVCSPKVTTIRVSFLIGQNESWSLVW